MKQSLSEFANSYEKKVENKQKQSNLGERELKKQFDQYSKLSKPELTKELFKEVEKQKQDGNFNFNNLANKIEGIRPMLSEEQIKNLDNLLNQIK